MVFSSVPAYLDPPHWQQQSSLQQNGSESASQFPPPAPSSIRPGSMADRARTAKIHLPEAAQKCPRCESTNTKFCYFNNYSLSQPRHFCKTCRRYWTRGGTLRSVPVGGGCRRNKKNRNRPKSPVSADRQINNGEINPQLPSVETFQNLSYGSNNGTSGLNFNPIQTHIGEAATGSSSTQTELGFPELGFQIGNPNSRMAMLSAGAQQWRPQVEQFPLFGGFQVQPSTDLYSFQSEAVEAPNRLKTLSLGNRFEDEQIPGKTEHNQVLNSSKEIFGTSENSNQFWGGGNMWTDLSGLNSSSTNHFL